MTTAAIPPVPRGRYGFPQALRMEWIKLRSLRSTWWTLAVTLAGAVGIATAVGVNTKDAAADLTNNALAGVSLGLLLTGVLGVLVMSGEYSSGMIRATLAAIPNRPMVLAAKAAVFGTVALAVGEAAAFIAFLAGTAALPATAPAPSLDQPGVLRAVVMGGAGYCLIGLIGLGLGAIIRHTPAAIAVLVGGVYVLAQAVAVVRQFDHGVRPDRDRRQLAERGRAGGRRAGPVPVAVGRARRALRLRRRDARHRRVAAGQAGRLSRTMTAWDRWAR